MLLSERLSNEELVKMHQFKQTLPHQTVDSKKKIIGERRMNLMDRLKASLKKEAK